METEKDSKITFLDAPVCNKPDLVTPVYKKRTYTVLLTNIFSFTLCWIGVTKSTTHGKVLIMI